MNHLLALCYLSHVNHYTETESNARALYRSLPSPSFEPSFRIDLLMTAPKEYCEMHRVILHITHPEGAFVSYDIPCDTYTNQPAPHPGHMRLGSISRTGLPFVVRWPSVGISPAPSMPMDWPLLGIAWKGPFYFDRAVPFDIQWGAMYMQRTLSLSPDLQDTRASPAALTSMMLHPPGHHTRL